MIPNRKRVILKIPKDQKQKLERICEERGISQNEAVIQACEKALKEKWLM